ncbi:dTMP kinase [Hyphobacterium sp. HN65]|uniref:Thymidylate kinase n=1 Tax=Hyphobacterium lacteum TaxID=3116575 RepID=A0ABU7LM03_9PROT|nr:dTMP kinase [Hyphobacterium sp. HN65]MEE2524955.1 dTMP kinase [Hyphobacterium sp. HN65]
MASGLFVTLEGGEGSGKSTLARALDEALSAAGHSVVMTREPGGTPGAEQIRQLLVCGDASRWSAKTEALLFYAARTDHVEKVIRPAIEAGQIVICDRFSDSTMAYQGAAGGVPLDELKQLHALVLGDFKPDLTLLIDLDPDAGLARTQERDGSEARFESKALAFHKRLRAAYKELSASEPDRFCVLDGELPPDELAEIAISAIERTLAE